MSMDLHMEQRVQTGSLGSNVGDKALGRIGRSIGAVMKVTHNFDYASKVCDRSGCHPMRTVQLDMELLTKVQDDNVYGHIRGKKRSEFTISENFLF